MLAAGGMSEGVLTYVGTIFSLICLALPLAADSDTAWGAGRDGWRELTHRIVDPAPYKPLRSLMLGFLSLSFFFLSPVAPSPVSDVEKMANEGLIK